MLLNEFIYREHLLATLNSSHPNCSEVAVAHGKMNSSCFFFCLAVSDDSINVLNKVLCSFGSFLVYVVSVTDSLDLDVKGTG